MKVLSAVLVLVCLLPLSASAAEIESDDATQLRRLLSVLEKHTEIATKTKLNSDFVPGMVTVLYGDDLENKGVETVWEALGLVPGMNLFIENNGVRQVLVRGVGETFGSGNIKFLLNGISANSTLFGTAFPLLEVPVSQVERIEIIRGPGSAVHGEYANAGVVNVITRTEGNRIYGRYGSFTSYTGGGLFSWSGRDDDLRLSINLAGRETDGADVMTGTDSLYGMGLGAVSQAPGNANQDRESLSGFFILDFRDFRFSTQYMEEGHADHFGVQDALSPPDDRIVATHDHLLLDVRQKLNVIEDLQINVYLGWQYYETDVDNMFLFPPGFPGFPNGRIIGPHYERIRYHGGADVIWEGLEDHTILFAWSFARTKIDEGWQDSNFVPSTGTPTASGQVERFQGLENIIEVGKKRVMHSVTLQDELRISNSLSVTGGLRYDNYDDVGNAVSPRLAGVWRLTDRHIMKAQYARAFRPPTFLEMYAINQPILTGNPDIDPAVSDTYELGYIYREPGTTGRATIFYTDLKDLIVAQGGTFSNAGSARLKGIELELEHELVQGLGLDANLSYVDTEDLDSNTEIAGSANWLANLGVLYSPLSDITLNLQYQYVGARHREPQDTRPDLDDYHTVHITGSLFNAGLNGMTVRAGVKNLFNENVLYPAAVNTYAGDYPQAGRRWWIQAAYNF